MDKSILTQINEEIKQKAEFASWLGVALEDIPQELLDEAFGNADMGGMSAAQAKAGERSWAQELAAGKPEGRPSTFRDPRKGGAPEMAAKPETPDPNVGDFVLINGKPVKIVNKTQTFGNDFVYLQGAQKPVMVDRLQPVKKVGKLNVFAIGK